MRRITVLQILPALASGGVERGTLEVAAHLVRQGHRSLVISAGGRMVPQLLAEGSAHFTWGVGQKSLLSLRYVLRLRAFLRQEKVDVMHVRSRFPAWIAYLAWRSLAPKNRPLLVTTVHGCYSVNAYSRIMTLGEQVVVISEAVKRDVINNYQPDITRLTLIYRGVDTTQYAQGYQPDAAWLQAWYRHFPQTMEKRILTLPARVTRWKGQEDFVRLIQIVKQQRQDVHALIVGEINEDKTGFMRTLEKQIAEHGLQTSITLTGHRADVKQIMAISSIVYSLSTEPEAFGRTTLEALSLGVPVIGYQHGGVAEQLHALLPEGAVAVGNIAEAAILTLNWLHKAPKVNVNTQFTLKNMCEKTIDVYQNALKQAGKI